MNQKSGARGASLKATTSGQLFDVWLQHHRSSASMSLQKMLREPLSSLMICLVIGIALALPLGLLVVAENMKQLGNQWDDNPQISIYVRHQLPEAAILKLGDKLKTISELSQVVYISPEAGLRQFQEYADIGDTIKLLDENPLPAVYIAKPVTTDVGSLTLLVQRLKGYSEIEDVQLDLAWVNRFQQILKFVERFIAVFGLMLCLGVVLAIANTVRLAIESRREEIVVVKLVGGTDAFVRRPLLYSGLWFGLFGGVIAILLVMILAALLSEPSRQLVLLYQSDFTPQGLSMPVMVLLLAISGLLGLSGAWIATSRHLYQISRITH